MEESNHMLQVVQDTLTFSFKILSSKFEKKEKIYIFF